jgi:hypothetical protein
LLLEEFAAHWFSSFGRIPSALFSHDVRVRNTIHLASRTGSRRACTTRTHRWFDRERPLLFQLLQYAACSTQLWGGIIPKISAQGLCSSIERLLACPGPRLGDYLAPGAGAARLYFKKTAYNWLSFSSQPPPSFDERGRKIEQTQLDVLELSDRNTAPLVSLLLNGKLAFLFWYICGDDFHVNRNTLCALPAPTIDQVGDRAELRKLYASLEKAMQDAVAFKLNAGKRVGNFNLAKCRHVTDRSDRLLARAMGLAAAWDEIELFYTEAVKTDFDSVRPT